MSTDAADPTRLKRWMALAQEYRERSEEMPGIGPLIAEVRRIEVIDRCLAIGAQGLLALLPLLVVIAAFSPDALANLVSTEVGHTLGLGPATMEPIRKVVETPTASVNVGVVGALVVLVSATSFSRVLQRMYAKVFELSTVRRPGRLVLSAIWLAAFLGFLYVMAVLGSWPPNRFGQPLLPWGLEISLQVCFWWWTLHAMLLHDVDWHDLLPAAVVTTVGSVLLVWGSLLVMPRYTRGSVAQFGSFGLILALASWMCAFAGVLVGSALIGRLLAEQPRWQRLRRRPATAAPAASAEPR